VSHRSALEFDLCLQGEQHQATDGQRGGLEPGGVLRQAHGAVDHEGEFAAGGGQVGEGGPHKVTVAGWWGAGSVVGPQVWVISDLGEDGVKFSELGRVGQRRLVVDDQRQHADGLLVTERVNGGAGHWSCPESVGSQSWVAASGKESQCRCRPDRRGAVHDHGRQPAPGAARHPGRPSQWWRRLRRGCRRPRSGCDRWWPQRRQTQAVEECSEASEDLRERVVSRW